MCGEQDYWTTSDIEMEERIACIEDDDDCVIAFHCVVYDPFDRPWHFPHSDAWMKAKEQRLIDTILDWIFNLAWGWKQVDTSDFDHPGRKEFIHDLVGYTVVPHEFAGDYAVYLTGADGSPLPGFYFSDDEDVDFQAYGEISDSVSDVLYAIGVLFRGQIDVRVLCAINDDIVLPYVSGRAFDTMSFKLYRQLLKELNAAQYGENTNYYMQRIIDSLDGLQDSLSLLPRFLFKMGSVRIDNQFCNIMRRNYNCLQQRLMQI